MPVKVKFVATVGSWAAGKKDAVLAAIWEWAQIDENFHRHEVAVDLLGRGPKNPITKLEAYTPRPVTISGFENWSARADERFRQRIAAAGGSNVSLAFSFPEVD